MIKQFKILTVGKMALLIALTTSALGTGCATSGHGGFDGPFDKRDICFSKPCIFGIVR